jgi:hypothetical protein
MTRPPSMRPAGLFLSRTSWLGDQSAARMSDTGWAGWPSGSAYSLEWVRNPDTSTGVIDHMTLAKLEGLRLIAAWLGPGERAILRSPGRLPTQPDAPAGMAVGQA